MALLLMTPLLLMAGVAVERPTLPATLPAPPTTMAFTKSLPVTTVGGRGRGRAPGVMVLVMGDCLSMPRREGDSPLAPTPLPPPAAAEEDNENKNGDEEEEENEEDEDEVRGGKR